MAQTVIGRFFLVHEAQASRDNARLKTYEFLHATFSEYLLPGSWPGSWRS
ncbi:hypothetical protein [Actinophytocola sp.]